MDGVHQAGGDRSFENINGTEDAARQREKLKEEKLNENLKGIVGDYTGDYLLHEELKREHSEAIKCLGDKLSELTAGGDRPFENINGTEDAARQREKLKEEKLNENLKGIVGDYTGDYLLHEELKREHSEAIKCLGDKLSELTTRLNIIKEEKLLWKRQVDDSKVGLESLKELLRRTIEEKSQIQAMYESLFHSNATISQELACCRIFMHEMETSREAAFAEREDISLQLDAAKMDKRDVSLRLSLLKDDKKNRNHARALGYWSLTLSTGGVFALLSADLPREPLPMIVGVTLVTMSICSTIAVGVVDHPYATPRAVRTLHHLLGVLVFIFNLLVGIILLFTTYWRLPSSP